MTPVCLAVGANLGNSRKSVQAACEELRAVLDGAQVADLVVSAPMYVQDQPEFVNTVVIGKTEWGPLELFNRIKEIERRFGRLPGMRFGPRELDIDIVSYGVLEMNSDADRLNIPHPRAFERSFVLEPLCTLDPNWILPGWGSASDLLNVLKSQETAVAKI